MFENLRLFLFKQALPSIVPLVLSQHELKVMSLTKKGSSHYILNRLIYKFFEYPTFNFEKTALSYDFMQFIKRFNFVDRNVVLLVPELPVLQDLIKYDSAFFKKKNINEFLTVELSKHFPFRISELLYDYNIDEEKDMIELSVAAVPKHQAQNIIGAFNNLGVAKIVLPIIIEEINRALRPIIHIDKNYLLIIMDFSYVVIAIIQKGKILVTHRLKEKIINTINHIGKISNLNKEYIISTFLTDGIEQKSQRQIENLQIQKNLVDFIENVRTETSRLLHYYSSISGSHKNKINEIFLIGKFASVKGLKEYFESNYQVKAVVPDPFEINNIDTSSLSLDSKLRKSLIETPAAFFDSVGLGLRCLGPDPEENGMNLLIRS